jgi:Protein of unknown function (DUF4038)/Putative collagen-binding domain of a collagenase
MLRRSCMTTLALAAFTAGTTTGAATIAAQDMTGVSPPPPPPPPPPGSPAYPVKLSSNRRYLVDQNDVPWLLQLCNPQNAPQMVSVADATIYFNHRASQGFNCAFANIIVSSGYDGTKGLATYDGIDPFPTQDLTAPNDAYFVRMDQMIAAAANAGMVFMGLAMNDYVVSGNAATSWIKNQPKPAFASFGTYLGNRYKNTPNLIWCFGSDYGDPSGIGFTGPNGWNTRDPQYKALHQAIIAADPSKTLLTGQTSSPCITLDDTNWAGIVNLNWGYAYVPTYYVILRGYSYSPITPVFFGEGVYEDERNGISGGTATSHVLRMQSYWSLLCGACGQNFGKASDWWPPAGFLNNLDSMGAIQQKYLGQFFRSIAWYNLVPDVSIPCNPGQASGNGGAYPGSTAITRNGFVTAGYGTLLVPTGPFNPQIDYAPADFVAAALTPDGTLGVIYCPQSTTITIAMTKMVGPTTARWWDPSNNTYQAIAGSPFANTGTHNFTTPGSNSGGDPDWVLLLQATVAPPPPATTSPPPLAHCPSDPFYFRRD